MKNKILATLLCALFLLSAVSGCGMKLPKTSDASPGSAVSPGSASVSNSASTIIGLVGITDGESITLDMVKPADPPAEDAEPADTAGLIAVGSRVYTKTGGTLTVDITNNPPVILEDKEYSAGTLDDIDVDDFIAVALTGNTVLAIIHNGPGAAFSGSSGGAVQPDVEPQTSPEESPNQTGVPDSSEKATYTVTTDGLNVRSGPGTSESVLGKLVKGTQVTGTVEDGWLKFTYKDKTAYCKAQYLTAAQPSDSTGPSESSTPAMGVPDSSTEASYVVAAEDLNVRSGPGTSEPILGKLAKGTILTGTVKDGWLKFTYNDQPGYCKAEYLTAG